ncbi:syntabulin isoform X2 [Protopterus annectens]|uniref:syntabulin isoform X2 n=1 Tax=Protopterus annectens TaxID=7888 RepID=UPI001CF94E32|nr:syntabulin isoform X2 [Protopterus annectens]
MGPLQDYKQKVQEKENSRSRIPRLVLRPYLGKQNKGSSPVSESPVSEEDNKAFERSSSSLSPLTPSSNSFCSDDTGCPSSQSASPVKIPSDSESNPVVFSASNEDNSEKKHNSVNSSDGTVPIQRNKKEQKACPVQPGSEADFSSSSSTGSISAPEVHMSTTGNKRSSLSRSRGSHGRNSFSKTTTMSVSPREKDILSVLCKNQMNPVNIQDSYAASSLSSSSNSGSYKGSDTSPTLRRSGKYNSCSDNHGVKPPNPEQYLTPLQQKEVTIRHLKTKLKETENRLQDREEEIKELKCQLARMRDDWIEEECHRVEAQLALKEARKEIKQLKQVIETMKNSLAEKDKGIQKYFIDINIQNKKLESLLHSMEMAQNGALRDEPSVEYMCGSPGRSLMQSTVYSKVAADTNSGEQAVEDLADGRLLISDEMANGDDLFDEIMLDTANDFSDICYLKPAAASSKLAVSTVDKYFTEDCKVLSVPAGVIEQAIQTDVIPFSPDLEKLILQVLKSHSSPCVSEIQSECSSKSHTNIMDLTPSDPNSAILVSHLGSRYCTDGSKGLTERAMKELDFASPFEDMYESDFNSLLVESTADTEKGYWSNSFITDLLALAVPVVPTVAWLFATQRSGTDPVYNIGTMLRGCCLVALHSLRRIPSTGVFGPNFKMKAPF